MKKFLCAALLAGVAGNADATLKVFACEPEWGALVAEIAGDKAEVYVATTAQQDPHHIDARPSLIAKLRNADIAVCTGAGLEAGWMPALLSRSANPKLKGERLFNAAEKVQRLGGTGTVDRSKGDIHPEGNPHVQLDPRRMLQIGDALTATLSSIDTANAATYGARNKAFRQEMSTAMTRWSAATAPLHGREYLVYHDAWTYLFDWLGLAQGGTLEPLPGVPPTSQHLAELAGTAKAHGIKAVIHSSYDDANAVAWIVKNGGVCGLELPYTVGGSPAAKDLVSYYDDIVNKLAKGC